MEVDAGVDREKDAVGQLIRLIDLFDSGGIEGGNAEFEEARKVVEAAGRMTFGAWMGRVESEMAVDEVDPDGFRGYYNKGLSPAEAVLQDKMDAGVLEAAAGV